MRRAALVLCAVLLPAVARAELPVAARGSAQVTGGDTAGAKARALEDAFRQAVEQAIATLYPDAAAREASAEVIKKRILRRARAYVGKYKVVSEGEADGVYAITVDAAVADGQLAADLRALGVGAPPPSPDAPPPEPQAAAAPRPPLVLLAVSRDGAQIWATFGKSGTQGNPGLVAAALERELAGRGFRLVSAAGLEVPVAAGGETGAELPLDPRQAAALATRAGAGGAVVAAARIADGGRIRATRYVGAEIELRLRVDDVASGPLVEERVGAAGYGEDAAAAAAMAARAAAQRIGRAIAARLDTHWPEPLAGAAPAEGTLVRLRGVTRAADVEALARLLAAVPGARQVVARGYGRREVTLAVKGPAATRALADALTVTPLPDSQLRARAAGREIDVDISPAASPAPPLAPPR